MSVSQVTVRDVVAVLPQASVAVNVLVCEWIHPVIVSGPSDSITTGVLQASVAVALPRALLRSCPTGLHKNNAVPVAVMVGGVISTVHVTVRKVLAVLPHPSIIVHVLVCERVQLAVATAPSLTVTVGVPQASVAVAVPSAASI